MFSKLGQQDAEELRAGINRILRSSHPPKPNLNKAEVQAFRKHKRDKDRLVLTADKGVAVVITLNSAYNEVTFNEKSAIMKENLCTKYTPFTYKYIVLNENPPITKQNLHIFFFVIDGAECMDRQDYTNLINSNVATILHPDMSDLLPSKTSNRLLRSSHSDNINGAYFKNNQCQCSSFSSTGPRAWNSFPIRVKTAQSFRQF